MDRLLKISGVLLVIAALLICIYLYFGIKIPQQKEEDYPYSRESEVSKEKATEGDSGNVTEKGSKTDEQTEGEAIPYGYMLQKEEKEYLFLFIEDSKEDDGAVVTMKVYLMNEAGTQITSDTVTLFGKRRGKEIVVDGNNGQLTVAYYENGDVSLRITGDGELTQVFQPITESAFRTLYKELSEKTDIR